MNILNILRLFISIVLTSYDIVFNFILVLFSSFGFVVKFSLLVVYSFDDDNDFYKFPGDSKAVFFLKSFVDDNNSGIGNFQSPSFR